MLNLEKAIIVGQDIYAYPNFITQEECKQIVNLIESIPESNWKKSLNEAGFGYEISFYDIPQIEEINKRLKSILDPDVYLNSSVYPTRMQRGLVGTHHSDDFDFLSVIEASKNLKDGEDFRLVENNIAGLIMYFNDFEGGELYYSNQDITYSPKAGDLLIHSSSVHCKHQVQEVKSDVRYSHSGNLFRFIKVPKDFSNDA